MNTVALETSCLSKRREAKSVTKKKSQKNRNKEAAPPARQYDNYFQTAIEDVRANGISRLNIETFAEEIKREIRRTK